MIEVVDDLLDLPVVIDLLAYSQCLRCVHHSRHSLQ